MKNIFRFIVLLSSNVLITGCTLVSIKSDILDSVHHDSVVNPDPSFPVRVIKLRGPYFADEDIGNSKTGRQIVSDIQIKKQQFIAAGISELIVEVNVNKNFKNTFWGPLCVLPDINEGEIEVSWIAIFSDHSKNQIYSRSVPYKEICEFLFFPYGLTMDIIRPITGNWDESLGFFNNFMGMAVRDIQSANLNALMVQDLIQNRFSIPKRPESSNNTEKPDR